MAEFISQKMLEYLKKYLKKDIPKSINLEKLEQSINLIRFYHHCNLKELEFKDKTILILGGNSDVGICLARLFSNLGANLILTTRKMGQLDFLKSDLEIRFSINCQVELFDVLDFESHKSFYYNLNQKPNIVITCIGYLDNQQKSEIDFNETLTSIQTNFTGLVSILNIIANDFEIKKAGVIIGISSVAGDIGRGSNYIYGSSKSAFSAYLNGLRNRLHNSQVQVITVKPGFIKSKMTSHLNLTKILTSTPDKIASEIVKSIQKKKNVIYIKWFWRWVMMILKSFPDSFFKKLSI